MDGVKPFKSTLKLFTHPILQYVNITYFDMGGNVAYTVILNVIFLLMFVICRKAMYT
jgi:hypothetical protein